MNLCDTLFNAGSFADGQFLPEYERQALAEAYLPQLQRLRMIQTSTGGSFFIEDSDWDSAHFGVSVSRIREWFEQDDAKAKSCAGEITQFLTENGTYFAMLRLDTRRSLALHALMQERFLLCGTKVMLVLKNGAHATLHVDENITEFRPVHRAGILELAEIAFERNHFANDPHLSPVKVTELYRKWAVTLLSDSCRVILVKEISGRIEGFASVSVLHPFGSTNLPACGIVDLIATRPAARRSGLGFCLLHVALKKLHSLGVNQVYANTMLVNFAAQRLFVGAGFRLKHAIHELHWWKEN